MREVDLALERIFARQPLPSHRGSMDLQAHSGQTTPPAPHFSSPPRTSSSFEPQAQAITWPDLILLQEQQFGERLRDLADSLTSSPSLKFNLVTSTQRAEGRTTLILGLARELARREGRTLVVDADFANPRIGWTLGIHPEADWADRFESDRSPEESLIHLPEERLSLLLLRSAVVQPRRLMEKPQWPAFLNRLRGEFDHILVDAGPFSGSFRQWLASPWFDALVLVRNPSLANPRTLEKVLKRVEAIGKPVLGLVDTFVL